jgi:hypothetical protein
MTSPDESVGIRMMQVNIAPSWKGPYTVVANITVYGEDVFVFRQPEDGNFHMITHSMYPTKAGHGARVSTEFCSPSCHWILQLLA